MNLNFRRQGAFKRQYSPATQLRGVLLAPRFGFGQDGVTLPQNADVWTRPDA
jgi:hypothetical protein